MEDVKARVRRWERRRRSCHGGVELSWKRGYRFMLVNHLPYLQGRDVMDFCQITRVELLSRLLPDQGHG